MKIKIKFFVLVVAISWFFNCHVKSAPIATWIVHFRIESTVSTDRSRVVPQQVTNAKGIIGGRYQSLNQQVKTFVWYMRNTNSSISSYFKILEQPNGSGNIELTTSVSSNIASETSGLIKAFATDATAFNGFNWTDGSTNNVRVRAWFTSSVVFMQPDWAKLVIDYIHRASDGTETVIGTSITSALSTAETDYNFTFAPGTPRYFDTNDRLVIKIYGVFMPII